MDTIAIDKPIITLPDGELIGIIAVVLISLGLLGMLIKTKEHKAKRGMHMHLTVVAIQRRNGLIHLGLIDQNDHRARNLMLWYFANDNWWIERIKCGDGYVNAMFFEGEVYYRTMNIYQTECLHLGIDQRTDYPWFKVVFSLPNIAQWARLIEMYDLKVTTGTVGTNSYEEIKIDECFIEETGRMEPHITPQNIHVCAIVDVFHPPQDYNP